MVGLVCLVNALNDLKGLLQPKRLDDSKHCLAVPMQLLVNCLISVRNKEL